LKLCVKTLHEVMDDAGPTPVSIDIQVIHRVRIIIYLKY
jgi:hypothetical protein